MNFLNIFKIIFLSVTYVPNGNGGRILFLSPMGTRSHKIFYMGISEALVKKGHHVTMVTAYEPSKTTENIKEVVVQDYNMDDFLEKVFEESGTILRFMIATPTYCVDGLRQKNIQDLKKENFDVIIFSNIFDYCYLSFVHHFKIPYIYISPQGLEGPINEMVGNIDFPAISGNFMLEPGLPINFFKRLRTTLFNLIYKGLNDYYLEPQMLSECLKSGLCPSDMPPFSEIHKNVSLTIINSVRTLESPPRPAMPNIIYAGGAHIKPPKKLPKDLEDWVEGSGEEGFIFFSLGSALKPSFLPEKYRQILVKVFGSLKQRVLWKWNQETMPDLPSNVKLQKWLPQPDILGHPKIKLFITHGGLLSTLEACYNGVPVIGMPIFSDQYTNTATIEMEGWGKLMEWEKLEEKVFRDQILDMLKDNKIIETAKRKSVIIRDRLVPPDEEAAYWVEYVMRHKGAPHIMSPLNSMSWYEIYNVDVWIFILIFVIAVLYISWLMFKFILEIFFGVIKLKKSKRKKD